MKIKFSYQIPAHRNALGLVACVAMAIGMAALAQSNQKELRLLRFFYFSVTETSALYWVFAGVSLFCAALFCMLLARNFKGPLSIILDETSVTVPRASIRFALLKIPYASITGVLVQNINRQQMVTIKSTDGNGAVMSIGFKPLAEFERFKSVLGEALRSKDVALGVQASAPSMKANSNPAEVALLHQIAQRSKEDPLIGAKMGSREIAQRLIDIMKTERGVHIESVLCALGSLAGYACQAALRAQAVVRKMPETEFLTSVQTKDGKTFYFGDHLNKLLAESQYSVWGISAGGAQECGCAALLDITDVFKYVADTVGAELFGVPRLPDAHMPQDLPINYVRGLWPVLKPDINRYCPDPEYWPALLSLSIQQVMGMGKSVLDPCTALRIVMESAIPMSKVNLAAA